MSDTDYSKFKEALKRLEERYVDYIEHFASLPSYLQESIKESCIQRFEVCFDTGWKYLKKYLKEDQGLSEVPDSPKGVIKRAAAADVIDDAAKWIVFMEKRNGTSHDYSGDKADAAIQVLGVYIQEAIILYERMTGETWK